MSSSICPHGTLHLGYSVDYFPYVYEQFDGRFNGIFLDLFRTMARQFGCTNGVDLRKFQASRMNSDYELFDGAVDRGDIFTAIDTSYLRISDVTRYWYSTTAIRAKMKFMEKKKDEVLSSDLSFFLVFPAGILVLILISWMSYGLLDHLHAGFASSSNGNSWFVKAQLASLDLLHRLLNQYFIVFVFLIHDSYFNGNNLITVATASTTFPAMVSQFQSGAGKIVLTTGDKYFTADETESFLGGNSTIIWGGEFVDDCFRLVCDDSKRVGLFYEPDLFSFYSDKELNSKCKLAEIFLPRGQSAGLGWLTQSIQSGDEYNFLISRNHSRKVMDKINFALLTVYQPDNNPLLFNHYVEYEYILAAAQYVQRQQPVVLTPFTPISFNHLEIPLTIFGIGLAVSCAAFFLEQGAVRVREKAAKMAFMRLVKSVKPMNWT